MATESTTTESEQDVLVRFLSDKARGDATSIQSCLSEVGAESRVTGVETSVRVHSVKLDGNGRPMVRQLSQMICSSVMDYAIPRTRLAQAREYLESTGAHDQYNRLATEARQLFSEVLNTGEGGELLLFLLTERLLRLPQVFSKMYLKTNEQMHYHGSDGIHAGTTDDGRLALYWGESKLHADRAGAVRSAIDSLAPYLLGASTEGVRDLQLIRQNIDLDDRVLEHAIVKYLSPDDPDYGQAEYRGLCLVGFDSARYPREPNQKQADALLAELESEIETWKSHLCTRVNAAAVGSFRLHVFLVPFPSVDEFRKQFLEQIGAWHGHH